LKPHVFGLARDLLDKTGILLDNETVELWVRKANLVLLKGDANQLTVLLTKNRGTQYEQQLEMKFRIELILDEHGDPIQVPGSADQYQFRIVPQSK
jgi:hypothetical protein